MTGLFLARWIFLAALVLLGAGFGGFALSERRRR
jgi:hypothetical protein